MADKREMVIERIADLLRNNSFSFEYKVAKKPKGIKILFEVSQEQME